jgi:glycosyltransferase involved in cell wall biosynthesis
MALGTPVVSTTKGVEGLDVEAERHVLLGDTPGLFATQVLRILDDEALGHRLADEAQRLVRERHAWGPIGDTLEQVLQSAVAEHRARHGER